MNRTSFYEYIFVYIFMYMYALMQTYSRIGDQKADVIHIHDIVV
jgi:hypothetical protein